MQRFLVTCDDCPDLRCIVDSAPLAAGLVAAHDRDAHAFRGPVDVNQVDGRTHRIDETSPGYRLAASAANQRLAIEMARSAIRLGRIDEALAALDAAAPAPTTYNTSNRRGAA